MNLKKWLFVFGLSFVLVCGTVCVLNYIADPFGYFRPKNWIEPYFNHSDLKTAPRMSKPSYIATNPEKFSCVIIGGSNAGFFRTKTVEKLSGNACFNSYFSSGFFGDYLDFVNFYTKTMPNLKEIILNISNNEIEFEHDFKKTEHFTMPSFLSGKIKLYPLRKFLIRKIEKEFDFIDLKENTDLPSGEQNTPDAYDEKWIEQRVLQHDGNVDLTFETRIRKLCTTEERDFMYYKESIKQLKEIKELCESKGVKLTVIIGAVFISKKEWFESEKFYDWLREIAKITEFYDFSGFYDINLNPYNFYDANHFNKALGDKMLRIVYGQEEFNAFGLMVSQKNIEDYLAQRRADYERVKEEYEKLGTIRLFDKTHSSFVEESNLE